MISRERLTRSTFVANVFVTPIACCYFIKCVCPWLWALGCCGCILPCEGYSRHTSFSRSSLGYHMECLDFVGCHKLMQNMDSLYNQVRKHICSRCSLVSKTNKSKLAMIVLVGFLICSLVTGNRCCLEVPVRHALAAELHERVVRVKMKTTWFTTLFSRT